MYRYRPAVLERLAEFAIFPKPHTDPVLVRDYLKALYTIEIRNLRIDQQLREKEGVDRSRRDYKQRVIDMRTRYAVLSVPVEHWTE